MIKNKDNNKKSDRILKLKIIDGKLPMSSTGIVDKRLFSGENTLHAVMDLETCLWALKYDSGGLPEPLKQRFTSFRRLLSFVSEYMKRRNIEIAEVVD